MALRNCIARFSERGRQTLAPANPNRSPAGTSTLIQSKGRLLGTIEAASAEEAITLAAKEFGKNPKRLIAVRR
jgi:hypothetical protein